MCLNLNSSNAHCVYIKFHMCMRKYAHSRMDDSGNLNSVLQYKQTMAALKIKIKIKIMKIKMKIRIKIKIKNKNENKNK